MAVRLGRANVDGMLRSLTAKQFAEWEAFASIDPFTEKRDDYRTALIAMTVYNMAVRKEDRKKIDEFVLKFGEAESKPPQTWQEKKSIAYMVAAAYSEHSKGKK